MLWTVLDLRSNQVVVEPKLYKTQSAVNLNFYSFT